MIADGGLVTAALALVIGLLLGSVLPADLLARRRHIDIRSVGDGNPGAYNAFKMLGRGQGLVTLAYDGTVGVLSIGIAGSLGASPGTAYAAGIMAVVGHRFPVQLGFRGGGQGMAASAGMLVYGIGLAYSQRLLSAADIVGLIVILALTYAAARSGSLAPVVMLPVLVLRLFVNGADRPFLMFMALVAAHIWVVQVAASMGRGLSRGIEPANIEPTAVDPGVCPAPGEHSG